MLPNVFEEKVMRVYCKKESIHDSRESLKLLTKAFMNWLEKANKDNEFSLQLSTEKQ